MNKINLKYLAFLIFTSGLLLFFIYLPSSLKKRNEVEIQRRINLELINLKILLQNKEIQKAVYKAINIYKEYPKYSGPVCSLLGDIYATIDDLKKAEWFYREGINLSPKEAYCYIKLAYFYRINKQFDSAIILLNAYEKIAPNNPLFLNEYGDYFFEKGYYSLAIQYWRHYYIYTRNISILLKIIKSCYILNSSSYEKYYNMYINNGGKIEDIIKIKNDEK